MVSFGHLLPYLVQLLNLLQLRLLLLHYRLLVLTEKLLPDLAWLVPPNWRVSSQRLLVDLRPEQLLSRDGISIAHEARLVLL